VYFLHVILGALQEKTEERAGCSSVLTDFQFQRKLVRRASEAGGCALCFVLGLNDHSIERGCSDEAPVNYADPAQRIPGIGSAMPGTAVVLALENYARSVAGGQ